MSEMTVPMDPTLRLRAHVESILSRSSVPACERDDVAEEMYGHLWQHWQDAMAAGANALEAAEAAIRSFGEASRLGHEMTGAYHSRLYATTIGVLLPAMATPPGRPVGYRRMRLLLALMAVVQCVLVGTLVGLTPGRAVVFTLSAGLSIALSVLAFRAFGRAQRWALRYGQFALAMVLVQGAATMFSQPPGGFTIPILGVIGLWMLGPAIGSEMAEWFSHSRPLGRGLAVALAVAVVAGYLLPFLSISMPDPTQVSAADLDLRVAAVCTRDTSGGVTDIDVTATMRWSRLDLFPYGLATRDTPEELLDRVAPAVLKSGGANSIEWRTTWIAAPPVGWQYALNLEQLAGPDGTADGAAALRKFDVDSNAAPLEGPQFLPGELHAGQAYQVKIRYSWPPDSRGTAPSDPLIAVWYIHLDRFVVQALASCERPGTGVLVGSPTGVSR